MFSDVVTGALIVAAYIALVRFVLPKLSRPFRAAP